MLAEVCDFQNDVVFGGTFVGYNANICHIFTIKYAFKYNIKHSGLCHYGYDYQFLLILCHSLNFTFYFVSS